MTKYLITETSAGRRLDIWLAETIAQSRNQAQHLIERGQILVNQRLVSAHYIIKAGDTIEISKKKSTKINQEEKNINPDELFARIEIIKDTDDYIVINKPAGLIMHQASDATEPTVVDWFLRQYSLARSVGEDPERPGIIHRLDKEVSGLVVLAKRQTMFDNVKQQFQQRTIKKKYIALVHGAGLPDEGNINFLIERSSQGHKMAAKPLSQTGKTAISMFTVKERFHNYTLVEVQIKTGRTHQIRAHFSAYGHPVVGDDLYASKKIRLLNKKLNLGRIFLVAVELAFTDLHGEQQAFSIPLPKELTVTLEKLVRI